MTTFTNKYLSLIRILFYGLILSVAFIFHSFGINNPVFPAVLSIIICSAYAVRFRKNIYLIISIVFIMAYPVIYVISNILNIPYHYLLNYQQSNLEYIVFLTMAMFIVVVFGRFDKKMKLHIPMLDNKRWSYASAIFAIFLVCIGILSAWPPVLSGYSVESSSSQLFEYALIFLALSVVLKMPNIKDKNLWKFNLFILLTLVFCMAAPLLFGRRGPALMYFWLGMLILSLNFDAKLLRIVLVLFVMVLMRLFALDRAGVELNFSNFILGSAGGLAMSNHQGGVIVSSVTYLGLVESGVWDWGVRLKMGLGALLSFIPYTYHPFQEVFVHRFVRDYATIPGSGGFPFIYAYLWGGYFLVALISLFIRYIIWNQSNSIAINLCKVVTLSMLPRWYAYTLPVLIKFIVLSFLLGLLFDYLKRRKSESISS